MTADEKYYQSICEHDFVCNFSADIKINPAFTLTFETCTICSLEVSRTLKTDINSYYLANR